MVEAPNAIIQKAWAFWHLEVEEQGVHHIIRKSGVIPDTQLTADEIKVERLPS